MPDKKIKIDGQLDTSEQPNMWAVAIAIPDEITIEQLYMFFKKQNARKKTELLGEPYTTDAKLRGELYAHLTFGDVKPGKEVKP